MLHALSLWFEHAWGPLRVFQYIGVRAALAFVLAFAFALLLGKPLIRRLRAAGIGERAEMSDCAEVGAAYHAAGKGGTPTMGGVFWTGSILAALLVCGRLNEPMVLLGAALMVGMSTLGFLDDWIKFRRENGRNGMSRTTKFWTSALFAGWVVVAYWMLGDPERGIAPIRNLYFPLLKDLFAQPELLGIWGMLIFVAFETFLILACSHAVNVTDGLDGLAAGSALPCFAALSLAAYAVGHAGLAEYLHLPYVPGAGELAVMGGAVLGATLGFLWFNAHPAEVFLGDSGSLPMGALIAWFAIVAKQEFALPLLAFVFVLEVSTSLLQIYFYKFTGGRRLFKKAPLHHVFQLSGVPEQKIVARFWVVGAIAAAAGLLLIKLR
ncbi:MAG: phospho-N-acetylmuramoyl-pentapeptide-transferase [Planctomycetota bacterium]|nr:phospho-N-acetylmuramoyl-pentapeptide-transferase [Planctomycetota bacterium]